MKYCLSLFLFLFIVNTLSSQNSSYIDSLETIIKPLSKHQQLQHILEIPYDKYVSDISGSEILMNDAAKLAIELNDSLSLADIYLKLAQINAYKDKREEKLAYNLKAIKIYEKIGAPIEAGVAYGNLGYIIKWEDMDMALLYMRKSIRLLENLNETSKIDPIYDNYGSLQFLIQNYDSSLYYHHKSLQLKKQLKGDNGLGYTYANLATTHASLKNFDLARKFIDSSSAVRIRLNDNYGIAVNYTHTGDIFSAEEKYINAIENYKKSAELASKNNYHHLQKYCAEVITQCYLELNDYQSAFKYNAVFQSLKDSTLNAQTNSRVAELQIEFETEKKEQEIEKQKLEIKTKNLYSLLLVFGLLVLGLIIGFIYKKKHQLSKELKLKDALAAAQTQNRLQEQRLHISRDLHDNIGSQLTFIISSIDNLKFLAKSSDEKLKSKLTNINNFASNTISQLRDTIWAMNKNKITYEDFQGRTLALIEKAKLAKDGILFNFNSNVKSKIVFSSVIGINIFRVLQEAINNALKYAEASKIDVAILEQKNQLNIIVSDNGKGFDINKIDLGNGLENMQKRIEEIGGIITINSKTNQGTSIKIKITKYT